MSTRFVLAHEQGHSIKIVLDGPKVKLEINGIIVDDDTDLRTISLNRTSWLSMYDEEPKDQEALPELKPESFTIRPETVKEEDDNW